MLLLLLLYSLHAIRFIPTREPRDIVSHLQHLSCSGEKNTELELFFGYLVYIVMLLPRSFHATSSCCNFLFASSSCSYALALRLVYSPNSFLTLFITLSFSGSYGWSLLGISSNEGNASLYASTFDRIRSAIWKHVSSELSHELSHELAVPPQAVYVCAVRAYPCLYHGFEAIAESFHDKRTC